MESVIIFNMIEKIRREYLIARVIKNSVSRDDGCREWVSARNNCGYGMISFTPVFRGSCSVIPAHRAYYMAYHNVILTRSQYVCHTCDNPGCIEITHLFVGTPSDNAQDCTRKGRRAKKHAPHKRVLVFTDEEIRAIRSALGKLREVAQRFGVSQSYVSKLRAGKAKQLVG